MCVTISTRRLIFWNRNTPSLFFNMHAADKCNNHILRKKTVKHRFESQYFRSCVSRIQDWNNSSCNGHIALSCLVYRHLKVINSFCCVSLHLGHSFHFGQCLDFQSPSYASFTSPRSSRVLSFAISSSILTLTVASVE